MEYIKFNNFAFNYIILFIGTIVILPIVTEILKRIPVDIKTLGVIGTKVTERYTQAYKQMQLNKKKYAQ